MTADMKAVNKTCQLSNAALLVLIAVSIIVVAAVERFAFSTVELPYTAKMHEAADLCASWFDSISELKRSRGIVTNSGTGTRYAQMIGDDFSLVTTTLGSLESKETAANPDFAALIARWCIESGIDSTSTVGVTLSGSFPSLAIATLAATQTVGAESVVISSLGSSTFGANQPGALWCDFEKHLAETAGLRHLSRMVTIGSENDRGEGLSEEGVDVIKTSAAACGVALYIPGTLNEAIARKYALLNDSGVDLLINIGGNQAALGKCAHASTYPNGFSSDLRSCNCDQRGVMTRLADDDIPVIHLLNIKDLASRHGLPICPGRHIAQSRDVYETTVVHAAGPIAGLLAISAVIVAGRLGRMRSHRADSARRGD